VWSKGLCGVPGENFARWKYSMRAINISEVVGIWFHDVTISRINVDYVKREVQFECTIPVGWWNSPNRTGQTEGEIKGTLVLIGLLYLVMEPPDANSPFEDSEGIEVTSEGPVTSEKFDLLKLPHDLPEEAFLHYFFVNEWNSCIYVAATGAQFRQ
jgi:hypothetical protein